MFINRNQLKVHELQMLAGCGHMLSLFSGLVHSEAAAEAASPCFGEHGLLSNL